MMYAMEFSGHFEKRPEPLIDAASSSSTKPTPSNNQKSEGAQSQILADWLFL